MAIVRVTEHHEVAFADNVPEESIPDGSITNAKIATAGLDANVIKTGTITRPISTNSILPQNGTGTIGDTDDPFDDIYAESIHLSNFANIPVVLPVGSNSSIGRSGSRFKNGYFEGIDVSGTFLATSLSGNTVTTGLLKRNAVGSAIGESGAPFSHAYIAYLHGTTVSADNIYATGTNKTIGSSESPFSSAYISEINVDDLNVAGTFSASNLSGTTVNANKVLSVGTDATIGTSGVPYPNAYFTNLNGTSLHSSTVYGTTVQSTTVHGTTVKTQSLLPEAFVGQSTSIGSADESFDSIYSSNVNAKTIMPPSSLTDMMASSIGGSSTPYWNVYGYNIHASNSLYIGNVDVPPIPKCTQTPAGTKVYTLKCEVGSGGSTYRYYWSE